MQVLVVTQQLKNRIWSTVLVQELHLVGEECFENRVYGVVYKQV